MAPWEDPPEEEEADPPEDELEEELAVELLPEDVDELAVVVLAVAAPDPESVEAVEDSEEDADSPEDSEEAVSPLDSLEDDSPAEADSPDEALSPPAAAVEEEAPSLPGPAEPNDPPEEVVVVLFRIVRL